MKKSLLVLLLFLCFIVGKANAQCVAEVKNVSVDEKYGAVVVDTEYKINGVVVQNGQTRYTEESGTTEEIKAKINEDIAQHCESLIQRIPANLTNIQFEILKKQKELSQSVVDAIKKDVVGSTETKAESTVNFKDIQIKVTADEKTPVISAVTSTVAE